MMRRPSGNFDPVKYKNDFTKQKYDCISIVVPKGRREDIRKWCSEKGLTVNQAFGMFFMEAMGMTEEEWKKKEEET